MDKLEPAIKAIRECLGESLDPIQLAQRYAALQVECEIQLRFCMDSLTVEEEQP